MKFQFVHYFVDPYFKGQRTPGNTNQHVHIKQNICLMASSQTQTTPNMFKMSMRIVKCRRPRRARLGHGWFYHGRQGHRVEIDHVRSPAFEIWKFENFQNLKIRKFEIWNSKFENLKIINNLKFENLKNLRIFKFSNFKLLTIWKFENFQIFKFSNLKIVYNVKLSIIWNY